MKIYELFEVNSRPNRNDCRYTEYRIYNNSLYTEAESIVDCIFDADEEFTDEEYNNLVEKALNDIIETLKRFGRYPANGIPMFVAY